MVFLVLTYGLPMLIMVVCYTLMGQELWGSRSIGEHTERQLEAMKRKKKVSRLLGLFNWNRTSVPFLTLHCSISQMAH